MDWQIQLYMKGNVHLNNVRYIHALYYMIMTCITAGVLSSETYIDKIMLIFDCLILANGFAYLVNALGVIMAEMQIT